MNKGSNPIPAIDHNHIPPAAPHVIPHVHSGVVTIQTAKSPNPCFRWRTASVQNPPRWARVLHPKNAAAHTAPQAIGELVANPIATPVHNAAYPLNAAIAAEFVTKPADHMLALATNFAIDFVSSPSACSRCICHQFTHIKCLNFVKI